MLDLNKRYVDEVLDSNGFVCDYKLKCSENFNFAYDVVDEIASAEPDKLALLWCGKDGSERRFTYADLRDYSNKTANMLASKGVQKGDMVMVVLKRHYQFWFTILALHKLGAVIIPATFMLAKHDVEYRANSAGVKAIICTADGDTAAHVDAAMPACPTVGTRLIVNGTREGWESFDDAISGFSAEFERVSTHIDEPMLLYFSSGTTGNPKMVLHTHTYALSHLTTAKYWHRINSESLHLTIADTGWGKAVWGKLYGQMFMESTVFVYDFDKFSAPDILSKIQKYKINSLCCPPTMFRFFLQEDLSKYDLSSLQHCSIAGEALNPDVFNNWYNATGLKLMEGFGQTETTATIANIEGMNPKPGSMGKPMPHYAVDIVDDAGTSLPPGETGEVVIHIENGAPYGLFREYYKDPELTAEAMSGGLYHTGDTAWKDEDGYYWYVGRKDDVIKSSGYRIGPFEIESVLNEHPAVMESAVTGVPDDLRGNLVKATIVLREGVEPSEELKKELQTYVKRETAPYKYPRVIEFVNSLPRTVNGKVRRAEIRRMDIEKQNRQ